MKIFIAFMLLFFTNCLAPTAISAMANTKTAVAYSTNSLSKASNFRPKTETSKPKWIKVLEWMIPVFLVLGIILFISSFNLSLWASMLIRPVNYDLALVCFAIGALSALTHFSWGILKLFKKQTVK
jgi:hypothetical protein